MPKRNLGDMTKLRATSAVWSMSKSQSRILFSNLINCGVYLSVTTECIFPSIRSAIKRRTACPRLVCFDSDFQLPHS